MVNKVPRVFIHTVTDIEEGDIFYLDFEENLCTDGFIYIKNRKDLLEHHEKEEKVRPCMGKRRLEEGELVEAE